MSYSISKSPLWNSCEEISPGRRRFLATTAAGAACALMPRTAFASTSGSRDPRLLVIILRGALDGLAAVPPIGDANYLDARRSFELTAKRALSLDGFFGLNPNLPNLARLYGKKDALIVHAAATSYRARSHFDGQSVLESGFKLPGESSGWLNRAAALVGTEHKAKMPVGVSLGYTAPLIMRGDAPTMSWAPQIYPQPDEDTLSRVLDLYDSQNPDMADMLRAGVEFDKNDQPNRKTRLNPKNRFLNEIDQTIGFFTNPEGPRIAALSSGGWDTHAAENPIKGRLATKLKILDEGIRRLEAGLAPVWKDTVIAVVTEFGRTVSVNGTRGTDHGTAAAAFLLGGAVEGGRVLSQWPGLSQRDMYDGRDLQPTTHINGVFKGILEDHMGLDRPQLHQNIFPDSAAIAPIGGLLRS